MRTIYFDMDGTIANLYGVDGWLDMIINRDATPYKVAEPMVRMNTLARVLNNLIRKDCKQNADRKSEEEPACAACKGREQESQGDTPRLCPYAL